MGSYRWWCWLLQPGRESLSTELIGGVGIGTKLATREDKPGYSICADDDDYYPGNIFGLHCVLGQALDLYQRRESLARFIVCDFPDLTGFSRAALGRMGQAGGVVCRTGNDHNLCLAAGDFPGLVMGDPFCVWLFWRRDVLDPGVERNLRAVIFFSMDGAAFRLGRSAWTAPCDSRRQDLTGLVHEITGQIIFHCCRDLR